MCSDYKSMRTGNYSIGDIRLLVKSAVNQRSNRSWTLLLVKSGSGMYTIDGRLCCLNENDILFFPPHSVYSFASADLGDEYNESLDAVVLRFEDLWFESLLRTFPQLGDLVLRLKEVKIPVALTGSKWFSVYSLLNQLQSAQPERDNAETGFAEIQGSGSDSYLTSLDECTCPDFDKRGRPCKHIYFLAIQMGYTSDDFYNS